MSASTASPSPAPNPGTPPVLVRRAIAALADLVAVGVAPVLVGLAALERFEIIAGPDSASRFSPEDQARINEIDQVFNRAIELEGTVYSLSGAGWWWTVGLLVAATLTIHVVVPSLSGGRSPGKTLLGLRVASIDGGRARSGQHLLRTLGGLVDAMPLAVPGLLGWIVVAFDPDRRRFGDWLGRTIVVAEDQQPSGDEIGRRRRTVGIDPDLPAARWAQSVAERHDAPVEIILAETGPARPARQQATERPAGRPEARRRPVTQPMERPIRLADEAEYGAWDRARPAPLPTRTHTAPSPTFHDLALPESSLAERPLTRVLTRQTGTAAGGEPVWSERCSAWVYHDPASDRWFRHDTGSGRWQPLDRARTV